MSSVGVDRSAAVVSTVRVPPSGAYTTLVSYKETHDNAKTDPMPGVWTGTWRDPRFSPPADGGKPENALTGTLFTVNGDGSIGTSITVGAVEGKMRFWRNTSVANLTGSQRATLGDYVLGYEWNEDIDNGFRPAGLFHLSTTTVDVSGLIARTYNGVVDDRRKPLRCPTV